MDRKTAHLTGSIVGIILMLSARLLFPPSFVSGLIGVAGLFLVLWVIWDSGKARAWPTWKRVAAISVVMLLGIFFFP